MTDRDRYAPGPASGEPVRKDGEKWTLILVGDSRHARFGSTDLGANWLWAIAAKQIGVHRGSGGLKGGRFSSRRRRGATLRGFQE